MHKDTDVLVNCRNAVWVILIYPGSLQSDPTLMNELVKKAAWSHGRDLEGMCLKHRNIAITKGE